MSVLTPILKQVLILREIVLEVGKFAKLLLSQRFMIADTIDC